MVVLDILRHGEAAASAPDGDGGRPLTADGAEALRTLGRRLAAAGWRPTRVFASPLRRARDSARVVCEALPEPPLVETLMELQPDAEAAEVLAALEAHGALEPVNGVAPHVLLVSHMPCVAGLCAYLTGDGEPFGTGELRRVACQEGLARGAGRRVAIPGPA